MVIEQLNLDCLIIISGLALDICLREHVSENQSVSGGVQMSRAKLEMIIEQSNLDCLIIISGLALDICLREHVERYKKTPLLGI